MSKFSLSFGQFLFLFFVIALFWVLSQVWRGSVEDRTRREGLGIGEYDGKRMEVLENRLSFNDTHEYRSDENRDGIFDRWIVVLRDRSAYETAYEVEDRSLDGELDELVLSVRSGRVLFRLREKQKDVRQNYQGIKLSDLGSGDSRHSQYTYYDLNLDGWLDFAERQGDQPAKMVMLDNMWQPVLTNPSGNWLIGYSVETKPGVSRHVDFDWLKGSWNLSE